MLKFKLEATSISSTVHVGRRQRVSMGLIMSAVDVTDLKQVSENRPINRHWK